MIAIVDIGREILDSRGTDVVDVILEDALDGAWRRVVGADLRRSELRPQGALPRQGRAQGRGRRTAKMIRLALEAEAARAQPAMIALDGTALVSATRSSAIPMRQGGGRPPRAPTATSAVHGHVLRADERTSTGWRSPTNRHPGVHDAGRAATWPTRCAFARSSTP